MSKLVTTTPIPTELTESLVKMSKSMEMNDILKKIMSKEKETEFYEEMKLFAEKKIYDNKVSICVLEDLRHEIINDTER